MQIAFVISHNEGVEHGIVTPEDGKGLVFGDLYETEVQLSTWANKAEAEAWVAEKLAELDLDDDENVNETEQLGELAD